tara:strand:- start:285 stop:737 length:453 start_codon:yes stop_codon:yes gene_type:complete
MNHNSILLVYDSDCPMCCNFIRILDQLYKNSNFTLYISPSFSSLKNNEVAKSFYLDNHKIKTLDSQRRNTLIFMDNTSKISLFSDAVLKVLAYSNKNYLKILLIINPFMPKRLLNFIYKIIANNRILISKIFRFKKQCTFSYENIKLVNA